MQAKNDHFYESFSELSLAQRRLTGDERSRILAQMYAKAGVEAPTAPARTVRTGKALPAGAAPSAPRTDRAAAQPPQARRRAAATRRAARTARAVPFAAVLAVALAVGAGAAGIALLKMGSGKIGFFENAPAETAAPADPEASANADSTPVDAPRGSYDAAVEAMEAYTADVGVSATSDGVTFTLDSVSMDGASMNVFLTVTGDNLIQRMQEYGNSGGYLTEWMLLIQQTPRFWGDDGFGVKLNGQNIAVADANEPAHDSYRVDDSTMTFWLHYVLSELPQGDTVTLSMTESSFLGNGGRWELTANLDGESLRAGMREAAPGVFDTAATLTPYGSDTTFEMPLRLLRMAFGPVGGMMQVDCGRTSSGLGTGEVDDPYAGLAGSDLLITDDTGTEIHQIAMMNGFTDSLSALDTYTLTALGEGASSVTLTPVLELPSEQVTTDDFTLTTDQLKNGAEIEVNNVGGSYTVQNFKIEGSAISYELVPHGWVGSYPPEIIPDDEGVTLASGHSALASDTVDPQTGVYTVRLDYFAATEDELNQITNWHYTKCNAYALDTDHTVTLPLE